MINLEQWKTNKTEVVMANMPNDAEIDKAMERILAELNPIAPTTTNVNGSTLFSICKRLNYKLSDMTRRDVLALVVERFKDADMALQIIESRAMNDVHTELALTWRVN